MLEEQERASEKASTVSNGSANHKEQNVTDMLSNTTSNAAAVGSALDRTTLPTRRKDAAIPMKEANGFAPIPVAPPPKQLSIFASKDRTSFILLIVLYFIQGIPLGLAFGSIPFLLKSRLSYSQIGIFSLSTYPYSLKLFWSPIVDSIYSPTFGRRKSWIVPIQLIMGMLMFWMGNHAEELLASADKDIHTITFIFLALIFFSATQDIAVDGWALTLLSEDNLSYASTAQTIGLNTGFFLSFTVFLALNSHEFANRYFRSIPSEQPLVSLGAYLHFAALACLAVTVWLTLFKKEDAVREEEMSVKRVYEIMWQICKLKHIQVLCFIHFIAKIGFQANDAVTDLKLVERGLSKEDLALVVLIDFPFQMVGGWLAGKWSVGDRKLVPWFHGYWVRLVFAAISVLMVHHFPTTRPVPTSYLLLVILVKVLTSFAATFQFVGISAFHTQISDPVIGGTYMTLLNTISNLGGTWPRYFVLNGVDWLTVATCRVKGASGDVIQDAHECISEQGKANCAELGGTCVTVSDGYYAVSALCIILGALILVFCIWQPSKRLQALPLSAWRVATSKPKQ